MTPSAPGPSYPGRSRAPHVPGRPAEARPTRVLELCGSAAGGVRAHLGECARVLAGQGHDVLVAAPSAVLEGLDLGGARDERAEIGPSPRPSDLLVLARLRRLGHRADVVHAHGLRAGALAALALGRARPGRTRLVVTLHNRTVGGRATRAVGERLEALVAVRADAVLAVSPDIAGSLRERGAREVALAVIPAPERPEGGIAPGTTPLEPAWSGEGRRLLTVARLAPQKGLDVLLDAAALLGGPGGDASTEAADGTARPTVGGEGRGGGGRGLGAVQWAVAGDGPLRRELEDRVVREHLPVRLLGRREDVPALMEQADVVVQTSLWEGQPLTVQEALRAGAAVVATDVGGTRVTARGGALLVEPRGSALAEAVRALLADDVSLAAARERSAAAGRGLPGPEDLATQLRLVLSPGAPT